MSVPIAYITIIVIWSTTPLGIKWSGEGVGYEFGVAARMLVGLGLLLALIALRKITFPWDAHARRVYLVGGLSLFFAMASVYWAAQYIPSGWISVVFGISPIMTGILAIYILKERSFSEGRLIGMLIGLAGLSVIFLEGIELRGAAWLGVIGVVFSTIAQPTGAVLLKQLKPSMPAISITAGSLVVAVPLFILNWLWFGPAFPTSINEKTIQAILYLAIVGTGVGFPLYYYVLKHLSAGHVSLITLITPVTALLLGSYFNNEFVSARVWAGTGLIMLGLFVHEQRKLSHLWASR
ncbi:MAG: DMT family transporter [Gammaproteobacteria bacterium]|nr:DMT family transporter [Gammaproteobacteria bacterium]